MSNEERKNTQLGNLLEKPVYFIETFRMTMRPDGTTYMAKNRKFMKGASFATVMIEARKMRAEGLYDRVEIFRMRGVVDSLGAL